MGSLLHVQALLPTSQLLTTITRTKQQTNQNSLSQSQLNNENSSSLNNDTMSFDHEKTTYGTTNRDDNDSRAI